MHLKLPHSCVIDMEEGSCSFASSSSVQLGSSPAIDRYNPIIQDSRRNDKQLFHGKTLQQTSTPNNIHQQKKNKKIASRKKNVDETKINSTEITDDGNIITHTSSIVRESWSNTRTSSFITPQSSTRYLLSSDRKLQFDSAFDIDPSLELARGSSSKFKTGITDELYDAKPEYSSSPTDQVVVLKVSLHCRGCERKIKKHISKMEGVTSFNVDFAAKKVTVRGNVTPLSVVTSISKVKNAQLWPPIVSSPIPTALASGYKNSYIGSQV